MAPVRRTAIRSAGGNPAPDECGGVLALDLAALVADPSSSSRSAGLAFRM